MIKYLTVEIFREIFPFWRLHRRNIPLTPNFIHFSVLPLNIGIRFIRHGHIEKIVEILKILKVKSKWCAKILTNFKILNKLINILKISNLLVSVHDVILVRAPDSWGFKAILFSNVENQSVILFNPSSSPIRSEITVSNFNRF